MPLHLAPILRCREEALEACGLIQALDSAAVATQKIRESIPVTGRVVPHSNFRYVGTQWPCRINDTVAVWPG